MSHTIELKKVSKYYANEESVSMGFSRIDLELDMGEFVAITGESGSGKSTLLNVISGLDTYEEGEMFVCGEDTTAFDIEDYEHYRKTYIGNIFQDFNLVNSYSVYQNIELVMLLCGKKRSECVERITELITLVGLTEYAHTRASKLSGGQKQRVAIARALAKDAPIIVADEPTGNLDSESAALVMETLAKVSEDKLVVIVTHNYEQAEQYVTRKLTMHDGRVIDDKKQESSYRKGQRVREQQRIRENQSRKKSKRQRKNELKQQSAETSKAVNSVVVEHEHNEMLRSSERALGIRNAFNIPSKFILLLVVYLFVCAAVVGQYATTLNSEHQDEVLGYNPYFINTDANRIIVTKNDKSAFQDKDKNTISKMKNVKTIITNDYGLDSPVSICDKDFLCYGTVYPSSELKKSDLTYGNLPKKENEIVIKADSSSDVYIELKNNKDSIIGRKVVLQNNDESRNSLVEKELVITGAILDESDSNYSGYCTFYVGEKLNHIIQIGQVADASNVTANYDGTEVDSEGLRMLYPSDKVEAGKAIISDDLEMNFKASNRDRKIGITIDNIYFSSEKSFEVQKVFNEGSIKSILDIDKDDYYLVNKYVFINTNDYIELFDKGDYQISVLMEEEVKSDKLVSQLNEAGYKTFLIKKSLTDSTGGQDSLVKGLTYLRLLLELIVLIFIAYGVIKLIMKSRNTYFSTLRILGATKKNIKRMLNIELGVIMAIAYLSCVSFVLLVNYQVIQIPGARKIFAFLGWTDYLILAMVLVVVSLMISMKYAKHIFEKSALKTHREEV